MYGAIIGDLAGFPREFEHTDLTDRGIPLFKEIRGRMPEAGIGSAAGEAGEAFSEKTVLTAALEEGLLGFEKRIPRVLSQKRGNTTGRGEAAGREPVPEPGSGTGPAGSNVLDQVLTEETASSFRRFGKEYPLAGYTMDLSIWLFREDAGPSDSEDTGAAARVSPIAWMFQDDLYLMRHMARLQAGITSRNRAARRAADAAACAVFLLIHGYTKDYVSTFLQREFGYRKTTMKQMREEILRGGPVQEDGPAGTDQGVFPAQALPSSNVPCPESAPDLCVRAALTAFLYGADFEDVVRKAVSLCGSGIDTAAAAALAGSMAEAFFGVPGQLIQECRRRLPPPVLSAVDAFSQRVEEKKKHRQENPAAQAVWENAVSRATLLHPAAVQGNEPLEKAIIEMAQKRDRDSLVRVLDMIALRMSQKGRVLVPVISAKRTENSGHKDIPDGKGEMTYTLQAVRTKDGRLWQPAFTSRRQMEPSGAGSSLALSVSLMSLLERFRTRETGDRAPSEIAGIVFNPKGAEFFLPGKTIESVFLLQKRHMGDGNG